VPGIVGVITKKSSGEAEEELSRMVAGIRHESFYRTGTWVEPSLGVYVGWAAREKSFGDRMPICNGQGNIVLVFSGEEFREPEREAKGRSYLVGLYDDDGEFPRQLNGCFHGLVADRTRERVTLFNDRYGMHRLYYHETKNAFYFATEAKAILAVRPELRSVDPRGLGEFVACGCVLENRTMFQGIKLLPAAATWVFRGGSIWGKTTYFQPREWEEQTSLEPEAYYQELREVFARSVPRYFNGSERIGVALTGGLDTRMIMAWRRSPARSLSCYTFGGMCRDSQDVVVARQVAKVCDQPHDVIRVGTEFLTRFPYYAERSVYLTDGNVDVGRSHDLYFSEKARQIAPVKVVGTYASEMLGQVPTFYPMKPVSGLFDSEILVHAEHAGATYAELRLEHPVTFAAFRQFPWWHYGVLSLEQSQLTVRSPYLDNEFVRTVFRAPKPMRAGSDVRLRLIKAGNPALGRVRTDRGRAGDVVNPFAAASRTLQEFTFRADHAYDYAMPEWLARIDHLLSPLHLERLFLGRHKAVHFRMWYRGALSSYVREILLDSRALARPYVERKGLESVVRGHLEGGRNYTREIHKALALELLHRLFVDSG
jgi:asparagine synthase (glutamine-hydrolysing)